jgi:hypothetical protein
MLLILLIILFTDSSMGEIPTVKNGKLGVSTTIDLLALVDPSRDSVKGHIDFTAGGISMKNSWLMSAIRIPYQPSAQYDLELELNRTEGKDGIGIVLPVVNEQEVTLVLGGYPDLGSLDGLNYVDGKNLTENGTGHKSCLRNGNKIELFIHVRDKILSYSYSCYSKVQERVYDISTGKLSIDGRVGDVRQRSLALYQVKGQSQFTKIELRDYGKGKYISNWQ